GDGVDACQLHADSDAQLEDAEENRDEAWRRTRRQINRIRSTRAYVQRLAIFWLDGQPLRSNSRVVAQPSDCSNSDRARDIWSHVTSQRGCGPRLDSARRSK